LARSSSSPGASPTINHRLEPVAGSNIENGSPLAGAITLPVYFELDEAVDLAKVGDANFELDVE
jgi:hypothetical protein